MKPLYLVFLVLIKIIGAIPLQVSGFVLTRLSRIAYYLDKKHRNIAIEKAKNELRYILDKISPDDEQAKRELEELK